MITVSPVRGFRRGRMTTTGHLATLGNLSAVRSSPASAKAAVSETAENALSGTYEPVLVRYGIHSAFVWRDLNGWNSRMLDITNLPADHVSPLYGTSTDEQSRDAMVRRVRYHLAQNAYDPASDSAMPYPGVQASIAGLFEFIAASDHAELAGWVGFQRAYRKALATGVNETGCHDWACQHSREFTPTLEETTE